MFACDSPSNYMTCDPRNVPSIPAVGWSVKQQYKNHVRLTSIKYSICFLISFGLGWKRVASWRVTSPTSALWIKCFRFFMMRTMHAYRENLRTLLVSTIKGSNKPVSDVFVRLGCDSLSLSFLRSFPPSWQPCLFWSSEDSRWNLGWKKTNRLD